MYRSWRKAVLGRDDYICQACGESHIARVEAHHVLPFAKFPESRFSVDNGLTLCLDCHIALHREMREHGKTTA